MLILSLTSFLIIIKVENLFCFKIWGYNEILFSIYSVTEDVCFLDFLFTEECKKIHIKQKKTVFNTDNKEYC